MNPPPRDPDDLRPELLAAYADGELDPAARARVEQWLAAHPEAREQFRAQRELSPANRRLWKRAEPPAPREEAWADVRAAIDRGMTDPPAEPVARPAAWRRVGLWVASGIASTAAAAVVVWWASRPAAPPPHQPETVHHQPAAADDDPLAGYAVLPVAAGDDFELHRVPGDGGAVAFGGDLLPGPMVLPGPEDVTLEDVDPDDWPDGEPRMTTGPGDAPMLFGAKPR